MGGGAVAFWNGRLQMGIETVLDTVEFDKVAKDARLVFTGEGRLDGQSVRGKVVAGVGRRAKAAGVPVVAVDQQKVSKLDSVERASSPTS